MFTSSEFFWKITKPNIWWLLVIKDQSWQEEVAGRRMISLAVRNCVSHTVSHYCWEDGFTIVQIQKHRADFFGMPQENAFADQTSLWLKTNSRIVSVFESTSAAVTQFGVRWTRTGGEVTNSTSIFDSRLLTVLNCTQFSSLMLLSCSLGRIHRTSGTGFFVVSTKLPQALGLTTLLHISIYFLSNCRWCARSLISRVSGGKTEKTKSVNSLFKADSFTRFIALLV